MMPGKFSAKGRLSSRWNSLYLKAIDQDRWNNVQEAIAQYQRCATAIEHDMEQFRVAFTQDQLYNIKKTCACLRVRAKTLRNMNRGDPLTLTEMLRLGPLMKNFLSWKAPFPLVVRNPDYSDDSSSASSTRSLTEINQYEDEELLATTNVSGKPLLPMLRIQPSKHRISIRLKSVGLKHPDRLVQPFVSVSVKDDVGLSITPTQDLQYPMRTEGNLVIFEQDVHIQRYLEDIFKGCAIYFEIKHYKEKQRILETKCYTFLEPKLIRGGDFVLNLFKRPIQYNKRKLTPMTSKPLYLNLYVTIHDEKNLDLNEFDD